MPTVVNKTPLVLYAQNTYGGKDLKLKPQQEYTHSSEFWVWLHPYALCHIGTKLRPIELLRHFTITEADDYEDKYTITLNEQQKVQATPLIGWNLMSERTITFCNFTRYYLFINEVLVRPWCQEQGLWLGRPRVFIVGNNSHNDFLYSTTKTHLFVEMNHNDPFGPLDWLFC